MKPNPVHRLPAPLEAAVQRLKLAAREAAERTIESLGLAALASSNAFQRDGLLGAQFELNRKSAIFVLTFNDAFDERLLRDLGAAPAQPNATAGEVDEQSPGSAMTDWAGLSLVEDQEVEALISADRFGMDIAHACEWELRELDGYVASLLGRAGATGPGPGSEQPPEQRDRNPLRPDLVGHAMIRGIAATSERPEIRKVMSTELSRSLAALLPATYASIVADLRNAGVRPLGLAVRNRASRASAAGGTDEGDASTVHPPLQPGGARDDRSNSGRSGFAPSQGMDSRHGGRRSAGSGGESRGTHAAASLGPIDPALMSLIRRLANVGGGGSGTGNDPGWSDFGGDAQAQGSGPAVLPANLIRAHRDELRQASSGALDHMVIDVIGFLFDQILADPKVPPQMARQIARLQLPVLRAALGDPQFFSSRRHPVRRFVNRIATLGAAFEDFDEDGARAFLHKVKSLVHEVVEGDFEHIELYEQKLSALEKLAGEIAASDVQGAGSGDVAALLSEKEDQQRLRQLYAQRLTSELKDVDAPPFLRDFIANVWGQVLQRAAERDPQGEQGALAQRLRTTGRELYLSIQPKATPAHRKAFLAELPRMMQELTEGMNLIGWPEAQRRAFFGQLMPAHAEALKSPAGRTLDINLMARKVEGALQRPLPSRAELRALPPGALPVLTDEVAPQLSVEEAERVGLVQDSAVDWDGRIDIDLGAQAEATEAAAEAAETAPVLPGLPAPQADTEKAEPTEGRELANHVSVGFAYQMHLDDSWQKVKLSHVSPARTFFIFTHGGRHKKTVSLTQRMLVKLCETGRLKAFESAYLLDRATARARRDLATMAPAASSVKRP